MTAMLTSYLAALTVFIITDGIWITLVVRRVYESEIGSLMREAPDLKVAAIFFALHTAGIMYFAVRPALETGQASQAVIAGAFLGLLAYGAYGLTNMSLIQGWTYKVGLLDIVWGPIVTAIAAYAAFHVAKMLGA